MGRHRNITIDVTISLIIKLSDFTDAWLQILIKRLDKRNKCAKISQSQVITTESLISQSN